MATKYVYDPVYDIFQRVVDGGAGNDSLNGFTDPTFSPTIGSRPYGSHFPQDELFHGFGGDDRIFGGDGIDTVYGGNGKDLINGGTDVDRLYGGSGNDFLTDPDVADMYGQGGNDVMRLTVGAGAAINHGGDMTGGMGADQFRVTALGVGDIDDVNYSGAGSDVTIFDFHAGQGDKILFQGKLAGGGTLSAQATFDLLDANHDQTLSEADGSTAMGRVTWDGISTDEEGNPNGFGALHLQLGGGAMHSSTELEVYAHAAQLTAHDFILG